MLFRGEEYIVHGPSIGALPEHTDPIDESALPIHRLLYPEVAYNPHTDSGHVYCLCRLLALNRVRFQYNVIVCENNFG